LNQSIGTIAKTKITSTNCANLNENYNNTEFYKNILRIINYKYIRWVEKANDIKQCYCYRELTAEEAAIRADCKCAGWTAVCVDMEAERSCDLVMGECSLKYKLQACKILKYDAYCRVLNTLNNVVNPVIGVVNSILG